MDDTPNKGNGGDDGGDFPRVILHIIELRHPNDPRPNDAPPSEDVILEMLKKAEAVQQHLREAAADAEPDSPDIVLREVRDAIHKHGEQVAKLAAAVQSAVDLLKLIHSLGVVEPNTGEVAKDG